MDKTEFRSGKTGILRGNGINAFPVHGVFAVLDIISDHIHFSNGHPVEHYIISDRCYSKYFPKGGGLLLAGIGIQSGSRNE